jgi:hypothetical protein
MNPPTIGHEKLLTKLAANARGSFPYRVYLSQSQDAKKNPLDYKSKVKYARKMFPKHARQIMLDSKIKTVFDAMVKMYDEGFKRVVMVVGSDRVNEFDALLNKYNGQKARHGFYNFEKIQIISAGERDPDADGATGMSASKMRAAAAEDDFPMFAQGLPKSIKNNDAKSIYNDVRKGIGLKEQREFKNHLQLQPVSEVRENYVEGMFQPGDQVVIKENDQIATIIRRGSNYLIVESNGQMMRKWLNAVEVLEDERKKETPQDPDIKDRKGTQPRPYYSGLKSKSTKAARDRHFKKGAKMDDDNPAAYKPAPGDKGAKTKPSKHTKKFKAMYGEDAVAMAKTRIDREKAADAKRHDRMLDRARLRKTMRKNRETS